MNVLLADACSSILFIKKIKSMKEFALIFRLKSTNDFKPSPEQMEERMGWLASIASDDKLVDRGNTLLPFGGSARWLKSDKEVLDGPAADASGIVTGYMVLRAVGIEEAVDIARQNPVFKLGGDIEVRELLKRG